MRRCAFALVPLFAAVSMAAAGAAPAFFDVRAYGAAGDGVSKDTAAIQRTIDAAERAGGGEVFLPPGVYLSGSLYLKDNIDFHVGAGARVLGSPDPADYNPPDVCPQNSPGSRNESAFGAHLILCIERRGVTVRGPGTIDGNSEAFLIDPSTRLPWGLRKEDIGVKPQWYGQNMIKWRPSQMLFFVECDGVSVRDLRLRNSTYWNLFLHGCENVQVRGLDIRNERKRFHTHNGDGIDIDSCRHVTVSDCLIDTADDCITLRNNSLRLKKKRDCAFVTVRNCVLSTPCNCVRLGVGDGMVHDVVLGGIAVHDARTAINFVSSWGTKAHGVDFRNIRISDWVVDCRILVHLYPKYATESYFGNLFFTGISGTVEDGGLIAASGNCRSENIVFKDVAVNAAVKIDGMKGVAFENCALHPEASAPSR